MELEVKEGFKLTEFGTIPTDWKEVNLGKSSILKARIGWQGLTTAEYLKTGDYFLITGTDFKNGYIDWDNCVYVERIRYDQDKNIQIKIEDVLVTKDGTIGKVAYVDKLPLKTTLNSGVFVIRPINNFYNTRYFYFVLRSRHFQEFLGKLTAGSTISHLYQKDFVHYNFPLPPTLKEQKAIATALSDVDNLITNLDDLIAKKKAIKQGAMQQLLTPPSKGGKRLDGFDGEWVEKSLGDVLESYQLGGNYSNNEIQGDYPLIKMGNLGRGTINLNKVQYIENGVIPSESDSLKYGDVLFNTRNTLELVGKISVWRGELPKAYFNSNLMRLTFIREFVGSNFFMNALLNTKNIITDLKGFATGTTSVAAIYTRDLLKLNLILPSPNEQKAIAQILSDMDKELEELATKKEKYEHIKQGMMQELLTGKTRLV